jgi:hypothetical protein
MSVTFRGVYQQIFDRCTLKQIQEVLREIKSTSEEANRELSLTVPKDEAVRALNFAIDRKFAPPEVVYQLLWDSEEVGKQHILLLTPAPSSLSSNVVPVANSSEVEVALFDEIPALELFPKFEYPASGYEWVDFRSQRDGWLAKAYGMEAYRQSQGVISSERQPDGTFQETRLYYWKEVKTTLVAVWRNSANILEVRIDITGVQGDRTIEERHDHFWKLCERAFKKDDFIGLDVTKLLDQIVFERTLPANRERYSISRVELADARSGQIRVVPFQSENFDNDPGRQASLETMRKNGFEPSMVRIEWKSGLEDCPKSMTEPISIVIEKTQNGPELRILKRITNDTYEYIFTQLRNRFV